MMQREKITGRREGWEEPLSSVLFKASFPPSLLPVQFLGLLGVAFLAACTGETTKASAPPPPAEVMVVEARRESVPLRRELPGRISARRVAEVRARVSGILLKRSFEEGRDVKEGQVLFQIDPTPMRVRHASAQAALKRAQINLAQSKTLTQRYAALVGVHAVSQQEMDDSAAAVEQREAEVLEADAALKAAALDLSYATVRAPISGRIGKALVTEGALVGEGEATQLAVIQQLDPVYFDFEQSSSDLLALRRKLESGKVTSAGEAPLTLLLDDGSVYEHQGKVMFSDVTVDERTGMVTLRTEVPNPALMLLPGMFARGRIDQAVARDAITVPQRSVILGENGKAAVLVVAAGDKIERREVALERAVGERWVVASGLEAGARVVLEGRQKVRPGDVVKVVKAPVEGGQG
jgi:membrane fusion protein (multidrug efflux system)